MSMDFEVKSVHLLVSVFVGKFHDFILVLQTKPYYAQCGSHSVSVHSMVNGLGGSSLQNYSHHHHHDACDSTIEK